MIFYFYFKINLMRFDERWIAKLVYFTELLLQKVSQFMSRAARLNEAFSVVRQAPFIRPSLPTPGVAPWPVMSEINSYKLDRGKKMCLPVNI